VYYQISIAPMKIISRFDSFNSIMWTHVKLLSSYEYIHYNDTFMPSYNLYKKIQTNM